MSAKDKDEPTPAPPNLKPIESPNGLNLQPQPPKPVRISGRIALVSVAIGVLLAVVAWYGFRKVSQKDNPASAAAVKQHIEPAKDDSETLKYFKSQPQSTQQSSDRLQPPGDSKPAETPKDEHALSCGGLDPKTKRPYLFDPQTGRPCILTNQPSLTNTPARSYTASAAPVPPQPQLSPERQRLAEQYKREQEAILAPTSIRSSPSSAGSSSFPASSASGYPSAVPSASNANDDLSRIAALAKVIPTGQSGQEASQLVTAIAVHSIARRRNRRR